MQVSKTISRRFRTLPPPPFLVTDLVLNNVFCFFLADFSFFDVFVFVADQVESREEMRNFRPPRKIAMREAFTLHQQLSSTFFLNFYFLTTELYILFYYLAIEHYILLKLLLLSTELLFYFFTLHQLHSTFFLTPHQLNCTS